MKKCFTISLLLCAFYTLLFCQEPFQLQSEDYFLAPVNKNHCLPPDFVPEIHPREIDGRTIYVTEETSYALDLMLSHARQQGMDLEILSAYRSYAKQKRTHEDWIQVEIRNGYSREEAEKIVKTYSAAAGQSEHQLGTAVDLNEIGTNEWQETEGPMYRYLKRHAHLFGFVISYPPDRSDDTGYTFEPWHIRFVGTETAGELYANHYLDGGVTLNIFLSLRWEQGGYSSPWIEPAITP